MCVKPDSSRIAPHRNAPFHPSNPPGRQSRRVYAPRPPFRRPKREANIVTATKRTPAARSCSSTTSIPSRNHRSSRSISALPIPRTGTAAETRPRTPSAFSNPALRRGVRACTDHVPPGGLTVLSLHGHAHDRLPAARAPPASRQASGARCDGKRRKQAGRNRPDCFSVQKDPACFFFISGPTPCGRRDRSFP